MGMMTWALFAQFGPPAGRGGRIDPDAVADGIAGGMMFMMIFLIVLLVPLIIGLWRVFEKAGQPGWAALVPIYNTLVMVRIAGRPEWWVILYFIPLVNIVVSILVVVDLCAKFGQGTGFAIGMILLPYIFIPILGFGSAEYEGRRRRRRRLYDDEDDRPRRRRRAIEDEEEEEERPRRRRAIVEEDEEEEEDRPRPRRRSDDRFRKRDDRYSE